MEFKPSEFLAEVRIKHPLVHHITNYVTVNDCANITICAGGSPVMTDDIDDVVDMVRIADALVINIGTLNRRTVASMLAAGEAAHDMGTPVILDPVGAGATPLRTRTCSEIIERVRPDVIKGNSGEMGVLSGFGGDVRGVDSGGASSDMVEIVGEVARRFGCVAAATGEEDYISDGKAAYRLSNGHELLEMVSGTGCMLSSVVGCYVGACGPSVDSVSAAITAFNVSAEYAATASKGPGTFKPAFLDAVHSADGRSLDSRARIEKV